MTTSHKPFKDLSDAEKGALLLAEWKGEVVERVYGWVNGKAQWFDKKGERWSSDEIYRIAPEPLTPDSINWDHVSGEWIYMFRNPDGDPSFAKGFKPTADRDYWRYDWQAVSRPDVFASYRRGTVDWKDSLVIRPGYEGSSQ